MEQSNTVYKSATAITNLIKDFGEHVKKIVLQKNIKYLMPLESKGALIVDVACGKNSLPDSLTIIYPRALRYIPKTVISSSKFLLVDDIFFSGKHLKRIYDKVQSYGAKAKNIHCLTFLDFSSGKRDRDYEGSMHDRISENILNGPPLERKSTLLFLQNEMLEKSMPSVYDHLTIEANGVNADNYYNLLRKFSRNKRLLHYGKRGAYQTSSILIDDLFEGAWDVPPKVRLWWHPDNEILRITPVGFIANDNNLYDNNNNFHDLHRTLIDSVVSKSTADTDEAKYESAVLTGRLMQLFLLKKCLFDLGLKFSFENDHLDRYYPDLKITKNTRYFKKISNSKSLFTA